MKKMTLRYWRMQMSLTRNNSAKLKKRRDKMTPQQRSYCMSRIKSKNTSLEVVFGEALKSNKIRYESHAIDLPGKPDFVFRQKKLVVFVDGDFWHGWHISKWQHKLSPYWLEKILKNRKRDQANFRKLRASGWKVIRIWEHSVKKDLNGSVKKVKSALRVTSHK